MPLDPIFIVKHVPPAARRILQIADRQTPLARVVRLRNPKAHVTTIAPGAPVPEGPFDCVVGFDTGHSGSRHLADWAGCLAPDGQIVLEPPADNAAAVAAGLQAAGCQVFEHTPLIRAVRSRSAPDKLLLHCSIPEACRDEADIRVHNPNDFLRTVPGTSPRYEIGRFTGGLGESDQARLLLLFRTIVRRDRDMPFLRKALAAGYLIVLDFDDDPAPYANLFEHDGFSFRCMHAAQTATRVGADRLRHFVPELKIFRNELSMLPALPDRPLDAPVRVFFGAYNRNDESVDILAAIKRIIARHGDGVFFEVIYQRDLFDALPTAAKRFTPRCPYSVYLQRLAGCDIALLPLRDTRFNRCKSDLKFLECAAHGVTVLASPIVYQESVKDTETGLLFWDQKEFAERLERLIGDAALRRELAAAAAYAYVRDHRMLADRYQRRDAWYRDLVARADALRAAHRLRVPELYSD